MKKVQIVAVLFFVLITTAISQTPQDLQKELDQAYMTIGRQTQRIEILAKIINDKELENQRWSVIVKELVQAETIEARDEIVAKYGLRVTESGTP